MQNTIAINRADVKDRSAVTTLLQSEKLPTEDLPSDLSNFFIAIDNGALIGTIGLEKYDNNGLLRSLVVKPEYRNMNIASQLVNEIESLGRKLDLKNMYLLTETAKGYFSKKGYSTMSRDDAPQRVKESSEYSHTCPSSAVLMHKPL